MKQIVASAKSVSQILKGQRYSVDYYQREYRWENKQARELIDDLTEQFLADFDPTDDRESVQDYGHYYLGSIILSSRDKEVFIVDGQQRLTTLTLLLMVLHRRQGTREDRVELKDLIFSMKYGKKDFNLAVPDRAVVMESLLNGITPEVSDATESVQTIVARYQDLDALIPGEINEKALPYFCDWLTEHVHLVEISATTEEDAYTIFETMNDRGLSLTPLDMLKGYLLAHISDAPKRNLAAKVWRERIEALRKIGKDEDSDAVKAWLRAKHAKTVRERNRGAENRDFERIGTEFHRWVDKASDVLGLKTTDDFFHFTHEEMPYFVRQYQRLREASDNIKPGLEPVYHVAAFNFTLHYPLILAPLNLTDSPEVVDRKICVVATFLDILLARRAVNYLTLTFSALSYTIFNIMKEIRGKDLPDLVRLLRHRLDEQDCDFSGANKGHRKGFDGFALNQWSKRYIKVLLARMTAYVEQQSGLGSTAATYLANPKVRYEIEHIWADHPERHTDEFTSPADFDDFRNRIGGLLLLPKSFNASYGDLKYEEKLPRYVSQNLLAWSLHPQCYSHNPGFKQFIARTGLLFRSHSSFKKADLEARSQLYRKLAEQIWNPERLTEEAGT
ncbi:MAG: DUF262 domain-containing protein [Planctomycetaceae bacterium]|nr:DUF262 domain-containing protein [Planctomycetaceae bacterium]